MKKYFRKSLLLSLAGIMFFSIMLIGNSISVQAGGAKTKQAICAYQKFLGQKQIEYPNPGLTSFKKRSRKEKSKNKIQSVEKEYGSKS